MAGALLSQRRHRFSYEALAGHSLHRAASGRQRLQLAALAQRIDARPTEQITLPPLTAAGSGKGAVSFGLDALDDHARCQRLAQLHQMTECLRVVGVQPG